MVCHRTTHFTVCIFAIIIQKASPQLTASERESKARTALDYVERIRNSPCNSGIGETLLIEFDHRIWNPLAETAVSMSNLLTKKLLQGNGTFNETQVDDSFFFDLVRNNVDAEGLVFGSGICLEDYTYPKYKMTCPYAYKKGGIFAHDIAVNYVYTYAEYYTSLKDRDWSNATITTNFITYRHNESAHSGQIPVRQPMAQVEDGHWTYPYFDCGGGDIWMVTYSAPIFSMENGLAVFKGIGTIDIELTNIDINQCDSERRDGRKSSRSIGVFRGTHHCLPSTKCVPVQGYGFQRGSYVCECLLGFYFPDLSADIKAFNGSQLELLVANLSASNAIVKPEDLAMFQCLPCAEGCDTCVDDSPCLYSHIVGLRVVLLVLTVIIIFFVIFLIIFVAVYKTSRMVIMYIGAYRITCVLAIWPRHIGFSLLYGALLMKTWRVTQIFQVKSARKLNLSDKILAQRLAIIVSLMVIAVTLWTVVGMPKTTWRRTSNSDLKFKDCQSSIWDYCALIGECVFLLWGAYLCYVVRKAPSHFNESKYITWALYNNLLLGSFILIIRQFIALPLGPDIIYAVDFVYLQISVTATLCLIFVPKIINLRAAVGNGDSQNGESVTGRNAKGVSQVPTSNSYDMVDAAAQTDVTWINNQDVITEE